MTRTRKLMSLGALAAVLLAGSCASPSNDGSVSNDPEINHPISVMPEMRTMRVSFAGDGLSNEEATKFDQFVASYQTRGNGSISISAPSGPGAPEAIRYFGERLANLGVPRSRILVGTHDVTGGDSRIEVGYVAYVAHADPCGDWSKDASETASNLPSPNFGCATQHNLAAMVADPRDLLGPRTIGSSDATRRTTVVGKYEKGETTAATKSQDQTANISQIQ